MCGVIRVRGPAKQGTGYSVRGKRRGVLPVRPHKFVRINRSNVVNQSEISLALFNRRLCRCSQRSRTQQQRNGKYRKVSHPPYGITPRSEQRTELRALGSLSHLVNGRQSGSWDLLPSPAPRSSSLCL